jgi:hypothetical protein
MTDHLRARIGVGSRVMFDGEIHTVTEWLPTAYGTDVVLTSGPSVVRVSLVTLLDGTRARLLPTNDAANPSDDRSILTVKGTK